MPDVPPLPETVLPRQSIGLRLLLMVLRIALGGLFIFAAYAKWEDPQKFVFAVKGFKILPDHLAVLMTYAIPWMEAIAGVLLIIGLWTRSAAAIIALLLIGFITGIISVLVRGLDVKCTCFGAYDPFCKGSVGWCNIIQNTILLVPTLLVTAKGGGLLAADYFDRVRTDRI